ncbi:MAG: hypothetical protein ACXAE3_02395 [Candidatus Kariarchaeaceae archaeon]
MESTPTDLPLSWHTDGTPIFERGDIIREARPLPPHHDDNVVIFDDLMLPEHRHLRPELRFNLYLLKNREDSVNQAWLGKSHPDPRRDFIFGRIIQALDDSCRVILQRSDSDGSINDFVVLNMQPLQLAIVPPTYETVLMNQSFQSPARFVEIHAREEKRNIDQLQALGGPGYLLSGSTVTPNDRYSALPIPRFHPGQEAFRFLQRRPLYEMLTSYPKGFDFIDPPRDEFFAGAV